MRIRKRIETVELQLRSAESDIRVQDSRLKMLECPHEEIAFDDLAASDPSGAYTYYPSVYQKRDECSQIAVRSARWI